VAESSNGLATGPSLSVNFPLDEGCHPVTTDTFRVNGVSDARRVDYQIQRYLDVDTKTKLLVFDNSAKETKSFNFDLREDLATFLEDHKDYYLLVDASDDRGQTLAKFQFSLRAGGTQICRESGRTTEISIDNPIVSPFEERPKRFQGYINAPEAIMWMSRCVNFKYPEAQGGGTGTSCELTDKLAVVPDSEGKFDVNFGVTLTVEPDYEIVSDNFKLFIESYEPSSFNIARREIDLEVKAQVFLPTVIR